MLGRLEIKLHKKKTGTKQERKRKEKTKENKKPNQKMRRSNKTLSQKSEKGRKKNLTKRE
jgi:hypothetical protein